MDNVFIERLGHSLKYECVYPPCAQDRLGVGGRPSLDHLRTDPGFKTPAEVAA
jgi:hypothetical protein